MTWVEEAKVCASSASLHANTSPNSLVSLFQAHAALSVQSFYQAYEHLLGAGLYTQAHAITVRELAPECVLRGDLDLLRALFERIPSSSVDGWHSGGKVFVDYARVLERLPALRASLLEGGAVPAATADADEEAAELDELCRSVPKLLTALPEVLNSKDDARHVAALSVMSAHLIRELDRTRPLALVSPEPFLDCEIAAILIHTLQANAAQEGRVEVDDATRLRHIRTTALERFMQSIDISA
jgi:nuclear pore complex protein Nup98-Nup96